jgi:hypothetical protein
VSLETKKIMIENKKFSFGQLFFGIIIALFIGVWVGAQFTSVGYNLSAIRAGVGEYKIVDPTTGTTKFVWVTNSIPAK